MNLDSFYLPQNGDICKGVANTILPAKNIVNEVISVMLFCWVIFNRYIFFQVALSIILFSARFLLFYKHYFVVGVGRGVSLLYVQY
jgi:hypothetical protein